MKKLTKKAITELSKSFLFKEKIVDINIFAHKTMANVITITNSHTVNSYCIVIDEFHNNEINVYMEIVDTSVDFNESPIYTYIR